MITNVKVCSPHFMYTYTYYSRNQNPRVTIKKIHRKETREKRRKTRREPRETRRETRKRRRKTKVREKPIASVHSWRSRCRAR